MELLAEYKGGCDGLFLKLNKDAQEAIPYDEKDQGYKAYWGDNASDDGDDDDSESDANAWFIYQATYTITGQQGDVNTKTGTFTSEGSRQLPFGSYVADYTLFGTVRGSDGMGFPIAGPRSPYYSLGDGGYGFLEGNLEFSIGGISAIPESGGNPIPLGPDGLPIKNYSVIVKRIKEDKTEETIATIPRPAKPTEVVFLCEDCEINCVLMIRKKTDKFAVGICICTKEEDWILTKAQVKAELLNELPPIIQARLKAQELPQVKTELREAFSTDISGARASITSDIKADGDFKMSVAETVKGYLMDDIQFRTYITSTCYSALREERFLTGFMSQIKTEILSDSTFIASLKTSLGITASPAPTGTTGSGGNVPGMTSGGSGGNPFTQPFPMP